MTSRAKLLAIVASALALGACSSTTTAPAPSAFSGKPVAARSRKQPPGNIDDRSMCEWKGKNDREASETAGPGAIKPNVRRVFLVIGTGDDRRRVLVCREIDTNFDGIKDVVRRYNDKGESLHEESDTNLDGRIDTWITFARGRMAEMRLDNDRDGKPDEWKFFTEGRIARVRRDTNRDGKPDIWEIYREGKLERMGVDIDGDERVDRWDHDTELRRRFEESERQKEEEAAKREAAKRAAEGGDEEDEAQPKVPENKPAPAPATPDKPASDKPAADKPAADKSAADKPAASKK
ncbi:hypothetical protein [Polyangium aurulentum]|uniref:hypothetical protein n=1 Tax=Polyangium aurulentum TaxID=2567896 RepID=UPI001F46666C|nr:hypothetical protein [Polyangium aurulentum]